MGSPVREFNVAVVGATGVVGTEFFKILGQRQFPLARVRALASERSAGLEVECAGQRIPVETLDENAFAGVDIALFSAGAEVSRHFAPLAARAGALVIDNSSAWRMEDGVPLVVPEVNPKDIPRRAHGIIANPNCCTIPLTVALNAIRDGVGIERVTVATYQSASGAGSALVQELAAQTRSIAAGEDPKSSSYPYQLAYNVVPGGWPMEEGGYNEEEMKLVLETRKILHEPQLRIVATCVRVPVPICHGEAVFLETGRSLSAAEARARWDSAPGIVVQDDPAQQIYPTPVGVAGKDDVYVGRIRNDPSTPNGLAFWLVSDNLRKGAALNAIQIAEEAIRMGAI
ncbi:MAG TPA: aspartate-semialdehyde dehydrogenase [Candidatus Acidoferrales bacterium]|nr:aspartate-semialdehyde dehydrogenase [Candidatus Acidoferrales bacterium]